MNSGDEVSTVFTSLAQNGPWAVVAGFLLWQILKTWSQDREQLTALLTEFKGALDGLKAAVEHLTERLDGDGDGGKKRQ